MGRFGRVTARSRSQGLLAILAAACLIVGAGHVSQRLSVTDSQADSSRVVAAVDQPIAAAASRTRQLLSPPSTRRHLPSPLADRSAAGPAGLCLAFACPGQPDGTNPDQPERNAAIERGPPVTS